MRNDSAFDAVVVGGGILGAACFASLAEAGVRVALIEEKRIGLGATAWSGAVVRVAHGDAQSTAQAAYGRSRYQDLHRRFGDQAPFHAYGYLHFGAPEQLNRAADNMRAVGLPVERLSQHQIDQLYPDLGLRAEEALYEPESGAMDPVLTARAFVALGREAGGVVFESVAVDGLDTTHGQVSGVSTSIGWMKAPIVVVAAGASAPRLLGDTFGVRADFLWTQLIQVTLFSSAIAIRRAPAFIDDVTGTNGVRCLASGGFYTGLTTGIRLAGPPYAHAVNPRHAERTRAAGAQRIGWLEGARVAGGVCHADAYSDVPHGFAGPHDALPQGLLLATGFSGGGFKMAPYAAEAITAHVTGRRHQAHKEQVLCE